MLRIRAGRELIPLGSLAIKGYPDYMKQSIRDTPKKRGRPFQGGRKDGIMLRLAPEQMSALDAYIAKQPDEPSRPEAIRRLLDGALPKPKAKR